MAESVVAGLCALDPPVVTWRPGCDTRPPTAGTIVVPCVDMLDSVQQCRLLAWVGALGDVRILSLASRPIYPLVQSGAFLDALYYRLNVVYVELTPSVSPA